MSKGIQHKKTTSRARKNANRRNDQSKLRRKKCVRTKESDSKVIANSIHSLNVKSIIGLERYLKVEATTSQKINVGWTEDYERMINDLSACTNNAVNILTGGNTSFNPLSSGLSIESAFSYVINLFEHEVLPKGFEYNIDKNEDTGDYYFTVYKESQAFGDWLAFEIKPIVKKLEREKDQKLFEIFMNFLRSFSCKTGINFWRDGLMGAAEYWMLDSINVDDFDNEDEYYYTRYKIEECIRDYQDGGEADRILQYIFNYAESKTADALLDDIDYYLNLKFSRNNKAIANWIKEACQFLKLNGCLDDFCYDELFRNYYNEEGLRLHDQYNIIWDSTDEYTAHTENALNNMASGCGLVSPCINYKIDKEVKFIDWVEFEERSKWIDKIHPLWQFYDKLLETLKLKKTNARK